MRSISLAVLSATALLATACASNPRPNPLPHRLNPLHRSWRVPLRLHPLQPRRRDLLPARKRISPPRIRIGSISTTTNTTWMTLTAALWPARPRG